MSTVTSLVTAYLGQNRLFEPRVYRIYFVLSQDWVKLATTSVAQNEQKWLREMSLFSCQYSYLPLFDHGGIYRAKSIGQICQKRPVTKKLPLLGALSFNGAGERTSAYPLRGSAPASAACRRPRQLAKNAPRFLHARSFAGSSPRDGPITKKPPLLGALSINGAGERT